MSQYEKSSTIRFTLRAFSTVPLTLQPIPPPYPPACETKLTAEVSNTLHDAT